MLSTVTEVYFLFLHHWVGLGEWAVCCESALEREKQSSTRIHRYYPKMTNSHQWKFFSRYITNDTILPFPTCWGATPLQSFPSLFFLWLVFYFICCPSLFKVQFEAIPNGCRASCCGANWSISAWASANWQCCLQTLLLAEASQNSKHEKLISSYRRHLSLRYAA